jgi:hypothetical protein
VAVSLQTVFAIGHFGIGASAHLARQGSVTLLRRDTVAGSQEGSQIDTKAHEVSNVSQLHHEDKGTVNAMVEETVSALVSVRTKAASVTSEHWFLYSLSLALMVSLASVLWNNFVAAKMQSSKVRSSWEHGSTQLAFLATGICTLLIFVLFEHDWEKGSYYCPYWDCIPIRTRALSAGRDATNRTARWIMAAVCLWAGQSVLLNYASKSTGGVEFHPKFTLFPNNTLHVHVASAVGQYVATATLIFAGVCMPYVLTHFIVVLLAFWGVLVHLPTSLFLISAASGESRIVIPGFIFASGAYVYVLWRMLVATEENFVEELISYWLVMHVYVMCRFFFATLTKLGLFLDGRYTIAIFLGMVSVLPPSLGTVSMMWFLLVAVVFNCTIYRFGSICEGEKDRFADWSKGSIPDGLLYTPSIAEWNERYDRAIEEKKAESNNVDQINKIKKCQATMKLLLEPDSSLLETWLDDNVGDISKVQNEQEKEKLTEQINALKNGQSQHRRMAQLLFDALCKSDGITLDVTELTALLLSWHVPPYTAKAWSKTTLTLEEFETVGRPIYSFGAHIASLNDFDMLRL